MASEEQFDELRISVEKATNRLRGRVSEETAQGWIGSPQLLNSLMDGLLTPQAITTRGADRMLVPKFRILAGGSTLGELREMCAMRRVSGLEPFYSLERHSRPVSHREPFPEFEVSPSSRKVHIVLLRAGSTVRNNKATVFAPGYLKAWSAEHLDGQDIEMLTLEEVIYFRLKYTWQPKGDVIDVPLATLPGREGKLDMFDVSNPQWSDTEWGQFYPDQQAQDGHRNSFFEFGTPLAFKLVTRAPS